MKKGFLLVSWAITDDCNMHCKHCYNERNNIINTLQEVRYILDEIINLKKSWNVYGVNILGGEPFVFPEILQVIKVLMDNKLSIGLSSNGIFFSQEENCIKFKKVLGEYENYLLQISLESIVPDKYEYFRGGKNSYNNLILALNNLKNFSINYGIRMTVSKDTISEMENVCKFAIKYGASYISFNKIFQQGNALINNISEFNLNDYEMFSENIYKIKDIYGEKIEVSTEEPSIKIKEAKSFEHERNGKPKGGCSAGVGSVYITACGDVLPCRSINYVLGNLKKESLTNIWENKSKDSILYKLRNRNCIKGKCGNCYYRDLCGGCRTSAYVNSKDLFAEDPFCLINEKINK